MSVTIGATTVVEERPHAQSRAEAKQPHFLIRTSQILKKFTRIRRKSESREAGGVYIRSSRSMDVGPKPFMSHTMLHMRSESQPRTIGSEEADSSSTTPHRYSSSNGASNGPLQPSISRPSPQQNTFKTNVQAGPSNCADARGSNEVTPSTSRLPDGLPAPLEAPWTFPANNIIPARPSSYADARQSNEATPSASRLPDGISAPLEAPWTFPVRQKAFPHTQTSLPDASDLLPISTSTDSIHQNSGPSSGMSARRELAPRLATLPPPMMAQYTSHGSARLTPSIVSRHPPMPILNLPMLPPPTPTIPSRAPRPTVPLRSIPALPMEGPSEADQDADHENAMLGDSDEEDGYDFVEAEGEGRGGDASDEEDGEEASDMESPESRQSRFARRKDLPSVPLAGAKGDAAKHGAVHSMSAAAAVPTPLMRVEPSPDYFTVKEHGAGRGQSPSRTPRPNDFLTRTPVVGGGTPAAFSPALDGSPRPGLYHHASRSMVDLLSMSRKGKDKASPLFNAADIQSYRRQGAQQAVAEVEQRASRLEAPEDVLASPTLRRQRSLPTYQASSDPPPYPSFHPRLGPVIQPREEEGHEELPPYSNMIYLSTIMPRKMEFTAPGVMAKDRKWRRALCVLEGTTFKVYKCPPGASGVSAIEEWWERKVGVGDITSASSNTVTTSGLRVSSIRTRDSANERPQKIVEDSREPYSAEQSSPGSSWPSENGEAQPQRQPSHSRSRFHIAASLLHPSRSKDMGRLAASSSANSRSRLSMDDGSRPNGTAVGGRRSCDALNSSRSALSSGHSSNTSSQMGTTSPPSSTGHEGTSLFSRSRLFHPSSTDKTDSSTVPSKQPEKVPDPDPKDFIRQYTLQGAESGLASDYSKRKNVIRVRFEGEQFLLQARDVAGVVEWIEGIQAGTNVSLDLDIRPMPRGPMFPRRRRRRPRRPDVQATTVQ
ncbi:hypothetical protein OBBRIDRAFT_799014 [Obba rivulosa]|uniref:PH domain-containing protein n=1 Tax=Obba rivulosa TaxID=1052685 RepID=A0A8E2AHD8_9APHY|nr:hypothetical protein OBBRIDRAFT_799014 [Obba rivulosa]